MTHVFPFHCTVETPESFPVSNIEPLLGIIPAGEIVMPEGSCATEFSYVVLNAVIPSGGHGYLRLMPIAYVKHPSVKSTSATELLPACLLLRHRVTAIKGG